MHESVLRSAVGRVAAATLLALALGTAAAQTGAQPAALGALTPENIAKQKPAPFNLTGT